MKMFCKYITGYCGLLTSLITVPARSGKENALLIFVQGYGDAPDEGEGNVSSTVSEKFGSM